MRKFEFEWDKYKVGALALVCALLAIAVVVTGLVYSTTVSNQHESEVKATEIAACERLPDPAPCIANVVGNYNTVISK